MCPVTLGFLDGREHQAHRVTLVSLARRVTVVRVGSLVNLDGQGTQEFLAGPEPQVTVASVVGQESLGLAITPAQQEPVATQESLVGQA